MGRTAFAVSVLALFSILFAQSPVPQMVGVEASYVHAGDTLQHLLDEHRFRELSSKLSQASGTLKPEQQDYFEGALELRRNHLLESKKLLERAVNTKDPDLRDQERDTALTHQQVFDALMMLGNLYMRACRYGAAADLYDFLDKVWANKLDDGGESIRKRRHVGVLLKDVPPQTISISGPCTLTPNAEGYPIQIGDLTFRAVFDTGANFSQISESTAVAWGVAPLAGSPMWVTGFAGRSYQAHLGVVSELRIGTAILRNVVFIIAADERVAVPEIHTQLKPALGFPVLDALETLTFSRDGTLAIHGEPEKSTGTAQIWLGEQSLLVSLGLRAVDDERLFVLDTGAGNSFLTEKYLNENQALFPGPPTSEAQLAGGGGVRDIPAYIAKHLPIWFGATPIYLDGQHVLTATQGGEAENYFGVIGADVLSRFASYTIDLKRMEFSLRLPAAPGRVEASVLEAVTGPHACASPSRSVCR
jgi:hypothetical protein